MRYPNIIQGIFLARPNRFIAHVEIAGQPEVCHVKNTGRCRELLVPGNTVWLTAPGTPGRKTRYDLVAVQRGDRLINMDSQAPNAAFAEHLAAQGICARRERTYASSRFDFYLPEERRFIEVKGITLEREGICLFPDAPTQRGVKHIEELIAAGKDGYGASICFVIQMEGARCFAPNEETDPAFAAALRRAADAGIDMQAWDCRVTPDTMEIHRPVPLRL